jgi:hypothetical protein
MKFVKVSAGLIAALIIFGSAPSHATTYTYTGLPDPNSNNYITAIVDLTCAGPCAAGVYNEGTGLNLFSFTLTAFDSTNAPLVSLGSLSPGYDHDGLTNSLTLDGSGAVTNWFLFAEDPPITLYTVGSNLTQASPDCTACQEFAQNANGVFVDTEGYFGTWSVSTTETPLPAALPLFASGGALLGFFGWRRKRKAIATA